MMVTAVPSSGYAFAGWTGSISSTNQTISFIVAADTILHATFTALPEPSGKKYNLVVETRGSGKVSFNGQVLSAGSYQIPEGQLVTLVAIPDPGYRFRTWTWPGNWSKNPKYAGWADNPTSWRMTESISIIAVFEKTR